MAEFKRAAVIGTGTMGPGMGATLARIGIPTTMYDVSAEALERAKAGVALAGSVLDRLDAPAAPGGSVTFSDDLAGALEGVDIVLEAIPERLELKHEIFREFEKHAWMLRASLDVRPGDVDVPTLRSISSATGGRYFRATDSDTVDQAFAAIDRERKIEFDATSTFNVQEFYAWATWPGLILLLAGFHLALGGRRSVGAVLATRRSGAPQKWSQHDVGAPDRPRLRSRRAAGGVVDLPPRPRRRRTGIRQYPSAVGRPARAVR